MSTPENSKPTLVELLQSQVKCLQAELRKAGLQSQIERLQAELRRSGEPDKDLRASRAETDRDLPPIARTEANLWKAKFFESQRELTKANKGIRRLKESNERLRTRAIRLKDKIEFAEQALGNHPESNTDLAAEITRLRDENRANFHAYTKRVNSLSPVTLAGIGEEHFGNPIPQEWYAASKRLLEILGVPYPLSNETATTTED